MTERSVVRNTVGGATDPSTEVDLDNSADGENAQLEQAAAEERALREAALRISALEDEESLLREGLGVAFGLLQADAAALYLISDSDARPRCRVIQRHEGVETMPETAAPTSALAATALGRREPHQSRSWVPTGAERYRSAVGVPLAARGCDVGALIVAREMPGPFGDHHVSLLEALGQHLALSLVRLQNHTHDQEMRRLGAEFVSMASHEIRTPLTALQGFTELLLSRDVSPRVQHDWLNLMNQEAARLGTMIGEMLDLTRIDSGKTELAFATVAVEEIAGRVTRLLGGDGHRVRLQIEERPTAIADGDKLAQVLTNLVRNALDYSGEEEPVEVRVTRRCLARVSGGVMLGLGSPVRGAGACHPAATVTVTDLGVGMTAEELANAPRPFYRAESSRELASEGSGLGLAIAKTIIERHEGCMWATSRPGQGTTFGVCLPDRMAQHKGEALCPRSL